MILLNIFILFYLASVGCKVLPDYIPQCPRKSDDFDKCVLESIDKVREQLKVGIPSIQVPPLEPFKMSTIRVNRNGPNLKIKATMKNLNVFGGSQFKIDRLKVNLDKYSADLKLTIPEVYVKSDYDIRGSRILVLDLDGKGKLIGNFTTIKVHAKGNAKATEQNGTQYLQIDKIVAKVRVKGGSVSFTDTESPIAATAAQTFFNTSPGIVLDILSPLIEETSVNILSKYLNAIFATIPLSELLPE